MAKRRDELTELKSLTAGQLYGRITDSRKKLTLLRQDQLLGKLKNVHEITAARKSVARLQTFLDQKLSEPTAN